jgi:hypothetical protein
VKVAVLEPAVTTTDGETTLMPPVVLSATVAPPVPAGSAEVIGQVDAASGINEPGLQASELGVTGARTLTVPPVAVIVTTRPPGVAPRALVASIAVAVEEETVADKVATTPLAIASAFIPLSMQVYPSDPAAHVILLPPAVEAAPAITEMFETAPRYAKVH